MGVAIRVAPPDGWEQWPDAPQRAWFTNVDEPTAAVAGLSEFNVLRFTVLVVLERGSVGSRFPAFDELCLGGHTLPNVRVPALLREVSRISRDLKKLSPDELVSPARYLAALDLDLPGADLLLQAARSEAQAVSGAIALDRIAPADLSALMTAVLGGTQPQNALDVFESSLKALATLARKALRLERGVLLNL